MRTAAERSTPPLDVDEGWRDLISSAPPPPPAPPPQAYEPQQRATLPAGLHTDREGCVTRVQFGADAAIEPERPSFDAGDRRLWMVAGGLMGLATVVLLLLGVLTFKPSAPESQMPIAPVVAPMAQTHAPVPSHGTPVIAGAQPVAGVGRPLLAQHTIRRVVKHVKKHKKLAAR